MTIEALKVARDALVAMLEGSRFYKIDDLEAWHEKRMPSNEACTKALAAIAQADAALVAAAGEREKRDSTWFALVMGASAEIEDAANCLRDDDARRTALSGAKHYRDKANALFGAPTVAAAERPNVASGELGACAQGDDCRMCGYPCSLYRRAQPPAAQEVSREFTNELGNRIKITIEGPTSVSENILTPKEVHELHAALCTHNGGPSAAPSVEAEPVPGQAAAGEMPPCQECEELHGLNRRLSDLLTRTINALRGDPPPLTLWSWHDLPERAAAAIAAIDVITRAAALAAAPKGPVPDALTEERRDAARWRWFREARHVTLVTMMFGNGASQTVEMAEQAIDAAINSLKQEQP